LLATNSSPGPRANFGLHAARGMSQRNTVGRRRTSHRSAGSTGARLVLASAYPVVVFGLEQLFQNEGNLRVVARCTDGVETLASVRRYRPDVLVLDAQLARKDGLTVLRELQRERSHPKVVLMADSLTDEEILEAFRLGVQGMVVKEMAVPMVVQCVRKVLAGETWLEKRAFNRALDALLRREAGGREVADALTARELEIARLATRGLRIEEMAKHLAISAGTVKTHLHRVYRKFKVDNRVALTLYAQAKNLV
jgi:two-component system nitrate/nitrite response regulator NarL